MNRVEITEKLKTAEKYTKNFLKAEKYLIQLSFKAAPRCCFMYITLYLINQIIPYINVYIWMLILNSAFNGLYIDLTFSAVWNNLIFYILLQFISVVCETATPYIMEKLQSKMSHRVNLLLMERMSNIDMSFLDDPNNNILMNHVKLHKSHVENYSGYFIGIFIRILSFIFGAITFLAIKPLIGIIFLITFIPGAICEYEYQRKMDNFNLNSAPENLKKNYYRSVLTNLYYAKELRLYNLANYFIEKLKNSTNKIRKQRLEVFQCGITKVILSSMISNVGLVAIIGFSIYWFCAGSIDIGTLSMYIGLANTVGSAFNTLIVSVALYSITIVPHINHFITFLNKKCNKEDFGSERVPLDLVDLEFEFKNVSFKYPLSEEYAIHDLSFIIKPNEKIAIVGQNGAGKSTIIKLLLRFYEPESGEILLNGINVNSYSINEYWKLFSVCFQNVTQYALSLRENISLSNIEHIADTDRIIAVAKCANIDMFTIDENALETELTKEFSDDGIVPSIGQWQKIAVARAFFRKAKLMIWDEPSSALDPEAEESLFHSFELVSKNISGIIISHRLSGIKLANRIFFLKDGSIRESGTHEELMTLNGEYAQMYRLQKSKYKGDGV